MSEEPWVDALRALDRGQPASGATTGDLIAGAHGRVRRRRVLRRSCAAAAVLLVAGVPLWMLGGQGGEGAVPSGLGDPGPIAALDPGELSELADEVVTTVSNSRLLLEGGAKLAQLRSRSEPLAHHASWVERRWAERERSLRAGGDLEAADQLRADLERRAANVNPTTPDAVGDPIESESK